MAPKPLTPAQWLAWTKRYVKNFFRGNIPGLEAAQKGRERALAERPAALATLAAWVDPSSRQAAGVDLDHVVGDEAVNGSLVSFAVAVDPELALALLRAGASPTRVAVDQDDPHERREPSLLAAARRHGHEALVDELLARGARDDVFGKEPARVRRASVYVTEALWIFVPLAGAGGVMTEAEGVEILPLAASSEEVRAALDRALAAFDPTHAGPQPCGHRAVLAAAKARSEAALARAAALVAVATDGLVYRLAGHTPEKGGYDGRPGFYDVPIVDGQQGSAALIERLRALCT